MDAWVIGIIAGSIVGAFVCAVFAVKDKRKKAFFNEVKHREESATILTNAELKGMDLNKLVGQKGVAVTDIKPAGRIRIDTEVFEVRAYEGFIPSQSAVTVVKIGANSIIYVKEKGGKS